MYPKSRYAAEAVRFECHVAVWQYALHQSVERSAGFDSCSRAFAGTEHAAHGGGDRCVFEIERMYRDITRRYVVSGRLLHDFLPIKNSAGSPSDNCGAKPALFLDCGAQVLEHPELPQKDGDRNVAVERYYLPVHQMKDVTTGGVNLLVRRRNHPLGNRQVSLMRAVQRKLHNNYVVVEIHVVKLTVHVRENSCVEVNDITEVPSVIFLACTDVIEIAAISEHRHKFRGVFG